MSYKLFLLSFAGRENIVEVLVANHADVNIADAEGKSPLYIAASTS